MSITSFFTQVETHLKSGIATEHTYRAALQGLFDFVLTPAKATNEPKHEVYGAPDFVIQRGSMSRPVYNWFSVTFREVDS